MAGSSAAILRLVRAVGMWSALSTLCLGFQCKDAKDSEFVFMTFILPVWIEPQTAELKLGDTLWLTGSFPDTLLELRSGKYYPLENFDFKSKMCLTRLVDSKLYLSQQPPAIKDFSFVSSIGSFTSPGSQCGNLNFVFSDHKYHYRIGMIPHSTGIYNLNFLWPIDLHGLAEEQIDLREVINIGWAPDGRELVPVYEAFYFVINGGNTNFELFKESYRPASLEDPSVLNVYSEQKGSFAFRVID
jgi:hypothetical protein